MPGFFFTGKMLFCQLEDKKEEFREVVSSTHLA